MTFAIRYTAAFALASSMIGAGVMTGEPMAEAQSSPSVPKPTPSGPAFTEDDLFNEDTIQDLSLTVNTRDWTELREKYKENTYYLADLRWRGLTVRNVGIRSRGNASRNSTKPGLRVDFDRYSTSQEFLGFKSLVLDNMVQDPTMLRERVAMKFFREMGLPAPRVVHTRLTVNNQFLGLYTIVEPIDKKFLKRTLGENDGYLYEFQGTAQNYNLNYLGEELEPYAALFEPKTRETASMFDLYRPIKEMTFAIDRSPGYRFVETTAEFLDLRKVLTYVAVVAFLAERDGILGEWGMNNFYLYRFEEGMRFQFLPWDRDTALFDLALSVYSRIENNVLMRRLMDDADMRSFYEDELRRCAEVAMRVQDEDTATERPGWLEREIRSTYLQIRGVARQDTNAPFSADDFEAAVETVLDLATRRSAAVLADLGRGYTSAAGR